jgi:hypothetical protein
MPATSEMCNYRATTKSEDDDSPGAATGSLVPYADRGIMTLVKQVSLTVIPVIPRSEVTFLHMFTGKRLYFQRV